MTNSRAVAAAARAALPGYWAEMEPGRARFSQAVLTGAHGGIVLTRDFDMAVDFVNAYAPEHLEILAGRAHDGDGPHPQCRARSCWARIRR